MNIETLKRALDAQRLPFIAAEKDAEKAYEHYETQRKYAWSLRAKYEKINSLYSIVSQPYTWETPRDVRRGIETAATALDMDVATVDERMRPLLSARVSALIMAGEKVNQRVVSEQSQHALAELVASLVTLRDMTPSSD